MMKTKLLIGLMLVGMLLLTGCTTNYVGMNISDGSIELSENSTFEILNETGNIPFFGDSSNESLLRFSTSNYEIYEIDFDNINTFEELTKVLSEVNFQWHCYESDTDSVCIPRNNTLWKLRGD